MLWREAYNTWEGNPVPLPEIVVSNINGDIISIDNPCVILGGFDLRASAEIGVWLKLIRSLATAPPSLTVFLLDTNSQHELEKLAAITPKSQWATTGIAKVNADWLRIIQPDRPGRSFAAYHHTAILNPLMVGLPTEEAWDRFQSRLI